VLLAQFKFGTPRLVVLEQSRLGNAQATPQTQRNPTPGKAFHSEHQR
jgi:hypothetical protein